MPETIAPHPSSEKPSDGQETKTENPKPPETKIKIDEPPKVDQKAEKAARINKILSYAVPILILLLLSILVSL